MMKYPYDLSELRLSLLPISEQNRYIYEHSEFFDYNEKMQAIQEFKNAYNNVVNENYMALVESEEYDQDFDEEYLAIAEEQANAHVYQIFAVLQEMIRPVFNDGILTEEEYTMMVENIKSELMEEHTLNEATDGPDMTFWMTGLGKWISLGFGSVFTIMAALIMAGHTRAAILKLENYMNEIVETCDDGIYKQRSMWKTFKDMLKDKMPKLSNWFGKKDTTKADKSATSFREVQENYLAQFASKGIVLSKNLGFVSSTMDAAIEEIENNTLCPPESGLGKFNEYIANPINNLANKI